MMQHLSVLHVEDCASDASVIQRVFEKAGYIVRSQRVEDAKQMHAALKQQAWDVVICDYMLPHFDAPAALQVLHETGLDIPFIVVSGAIGEDVAVGMMRLGAHDYLMKDSLVRLPAVVHREVREAHGRLERRMAQAALRQNEEFLRALTLQAHLIDMSSDAIVFSDPSKMVLTWNKGAEETYGWPASQVVGTATQCRLRTRCTTSADEIDELLLRNGRWEGELEQVRSDGGRIICHSRQALLKDESGRPMGVIEINRDITQQRRDEEALKAAVQRRESDLAEKTVLLKEIHHRVKNNLAVIASLLSIQASKTENEMVRSALKESQERVHSMALIHEHLYGSRHLDRVNFADYSRDLLQELLRATIGEEERIAIELRADPIDLDIEQAVPCALILNELISNAFKHAFPDGRRGKILVTFRNPEPGMLELAIEDDGIGLSPGRLGNTGNESLGLQIVRILIRQLGGSVEQRECQGTSIVMRFPSGLPVDDKRGRRRRLPS